MWQWGGDVVVSLAEVQVALGMAEVTPRGLHGQPHVMDAVMRAQTVACSLAMKEAVRLLGEAPQEAASVQAVLTAAYADAATFNTTFAETLRQDPNSLLPSMAELEPFPAGGELRGGVVTHRLKGRAFAVRIGTEFTNMPRAALDLVRGAAFVLLTKPNEMDVYSPCLHAHVQHRCSTRPAPIQHVVLHSSSIDAA